MSISTKNVRHVLEQMKFKIEMLASSYMSVEDAKAFSVDVFYQTWRSHHKGCWEVHGGCLFCEFEKEIDLEDI